MLFRSISSRIQISTSRLDPNKQNLESKFYATKNIEYSLALAEQAYNKKDYDGAIKWALTSNELNKDNVQSWMIFAKANYKKGRKNDALYALLSGFATEHEYKNGYVLWPVRTAVSGKQMTPGGATELMEILGKEESIKRIKAAIEKLS